VAQLGAVAAAPTASVPVIADTPSGPASASKSDAATVIAAKKKADTTLSGAASESAVREPAAATARAARGRRVAVIGATAVAVAAVAVVAVLKLGGGSAAATATPTVTTPAPLPAAAPIAAVTAPKPIERVEVALKSDPVGAKVVRTDGVVVGVTPVTMKLDKGSAPFEVQLELDGYRAEKRTITADVNRELDVNLLKAPSSSKRAAKSVGKPSEAKPAEAKPAQAKPADKPADPDKELIPAQL
jgi:hypothetical protein